MGPGRWASSSRRSWELLQANPGSAPFLNSIAREPLTVGFPATTAASLSSLATGVPPGEHGLVGYTMALPGYDRAFNTLTWSLYGVGPRVELVEELVPESFQPLPTLAERAAGASMRIYHLGPAFHEWSGLTRAIGRGERFHAADSLEAVTEGALRLLNAPRTFVFGYHPRLDAAGHVHGVASQAWADELVAVDHAVRLLAEQLPKKTLLVVSGDQSVRCLAPLGTCSLPGDPGSVIGCGSGHGRRRSPREFLVRRLPTVPAKGWATSLRRRMAGLGSLNARSTRRRLGSTAIMGH
ncbi:MAG: alkaline phosphatase family protein [Chloroflexi bacterium]|nr:MAG: alkaline phosphatase family protein [Chloroflexota bacterium]